MFGVLIQKKIYWLVILGGLNTVISLFYYVRVAKTLIIDRTDYIRDYQSPPVYTALAILFVVVTVALGIWWEPVFELARQCVTF